MLTVPCHKECGPVQIEKKEQNRRYDYVKEIAAYFLQALMLLSLTACKEPQDETQATTAPGNDSSRRDDRRTDGPDLPYAFGLGETFKADAPVTYSMFFSDASWYAFADT